MSAPSCLLCDALSAAGVTTEQREVCPLEADALEVFAPGEGHRDNVQLRRCPGCGAFYRYRYHHEFDVGGSWDEYYLWRVPGEGAALARALAGDVVALDRLLRKRDPVVQEAAALAAWVVVCQGGQVPVESLVRRLGPRKPAANFAYRALRRLAERSAEGAAEVLAGLDAGASKAAEEDSGWILREQAAKW